MEPRDLAAAQIGVHIRRQRRESAVAKGMPFTTVAAGKSGALYKKYAK